MILEIAANNISSAIAAWKGGANRVELCDNLSEGGTTPSIGTINFALKNIPIPIFPIIRARGGDFLYSQEEKATMLYDISACADMGCPGIVIGALLIDGQIDVPFCKEMVAAAKGMEVTFHRAFDRTKDANRAMQQIIDLGCSRVLTSGQAADAYLGLSKLVELQNQFGNSIIIMPGAGVNSQNVLQIINETHATEVHASMKHLEPSTMKYSSPSFSKETYINTSIEKVKELVDTLKN